MKTLRPIFKCHGGKYYLCQWIIGHFPKNYTKLKYIEGCGGAASVLLNKERSSEEIYNDADPSIAAIVQELAADDPLEFINEVKKTNYDETTFKWSETTENNSLAELVRRRFSRGGLGKAFAWSERERGGQPGDVNAWETFKLELVHIAERLNHVDVYCLPVSELVERFDADNVLWYIDPPYLPNTRQAQKVYRFEMTEEDHIDLASKLNEAKGKVVLSGYQSSLYTKLYKSWNLTCRPIANHAGQGKAKQKRIECLWRNF